MFKILEVGGIVVGWIAKRDILKGEKIWEEKAIIDNLGLPAGGSCRVTTVWTKLDRIVNISLMRRKTSFSVSMIRIRMGIQR